MIMDAVGAWLVERGFERDDASGKLGFVDYTRGEDWFGPGARWDIWVGVCRVRVWPGGHSFHYGDPELFVKLEELLK